MFYYKNEQGKYKLEMLSKKEFTKNPLIARVSTGELLYHLLPWPLISVLYWEEKLMCFYRETSRITRETARLGHHP